jgi:transcriptional regulator with XRE-family HTH domain
MRLSQSEVAERLGLPHSLVTLWEHDQRKPTGVQLDHLSDLFGLWCPLPTCDPTAEQRVGDLPHAESSKSAALLEGELTDFEHNTSIHLYYLTHRTCAPDDAN